MSLELSTYRWAAYWIRKSERYGSLYHTLLYPRNGTVGEHHVSSGSRSIPESCGAAVAYKGTASSGRFADFINYYPRRKTADKIVREEFMRLGGSPRLEHPYSFVLGESNYLNNWYGDGASIQIRLDTIPYNQISFTPVDSCARYERNEMPVVWTKRMLLEKLHEVGDSQDELIRSIAPYGYVEAQLWDKPGQ